jgi:hypothetical protein
MRERQLVCIKRGNTAYEIWFCPPNGDPKSGHDIAEFNQYLTIDIRWWTLLWVFQFGITRLIDNA